MSISTRCSQCQKTYSLNESLEGKRVRCKECGDTFLVKPSRAEEEANEPEDDVADAVLLEDADDDMFADEMLPRSSSRSRDSDSDARSASRSGSRRKFANDSRDDDDYDDRPRSRRGKGGGRDEGDSGTVMIVLAIVAVLILIGLGVGGYSIYRWKTAADAVVDKAIVDAPTPTITINPNFPLHRHHNAAPQPKSLPEALAFVRSLDDTRRLNGARWFERNRIDAANKSQVADALVPLLDSRRGDIGDTAARTLAKIVGSKQVPALVRMLDDKNSRGWTRAARLLIPLKDPKVAEAAAAHLGDWQKGTTAKQILDGIGKEAEPALLKYYFQEDARVRNTIDAMLRRLDTKKEDILEQAKKDLKEGTAKEQVAVLNWLANTPAVEEQRAAVADQLNGLLASPDRNVQSAAMVAMGRWGGKENIPELVRWAENDTFDGHVMTMRRAALQALAKTGDEKVVPIIVQSLRNRTFTGNAREALESMGPEFKDQLIPFLNDENAETRQVVKQLLERYKTDPMKLFEQSLTDLGSDEPKRQQSAAQWFADAEVVEEKRPEVAKAIAKVFESSDAEALVAAASAMEKWATKETVPEMTALIVSGKGKPFHDRTIRQKLLKALAATKDETAVNAIISQYKDFRNEARAAMIQLGPAAEPAAIKMLDFNDRDTVREGCTILAVIGTEAAVPALQKTFRKATAPRGGDRTIAGTAQLALRAITVRAQQAAPKPDDDDPEEKP